MKKITFLLSFQFLFVAFLFGINPNKNLTKQDQIEQQLDIFEKQAIEQLSVESYTKNKGKKPNFFQRTGLKLMRKAVSRKFKKLKKKLKTYKSTECDLLVFKSGDELEVKVTEITETSIKYRKCDYLDGPIYSANKSEIFMIKYSNGTKEVIKTEEVQDYKSQYQPDSRVDTDGDVNTWFLGFAAGALLGLLGLLFVFAFPKGPKRKGFKNGFWWGFLLIVSIYLLLISAAA